MDGLGRPVGLLVVIVNFGLADLIDAVLRECRFGDDTLVMLVDNGSQPERLRAVAGTHGADLLLLDRNYGFAGAVNRAVAGAPGHDEVLLLNPDVGLTAAALTALRQARAVRGLTGVSPLLRNVGGTIQVGTAGGRPGVGAFVAYFLFLSDIFPRLPGVFFTRRQLRAALRPAWLCMACLLLDGDAFRRFGPIPELELVYAEDIAWGVAASRAGAHFAVVPDVEVVHEQGAAGAGFLWRDAVARLALRENGPWGGRMAVACMTLGLAVRSKTRAAGGSLVR